MAKLTTLANVLSYPLTSTLNRSEAVRKYKDCSSAMLTKVLQVLDPPRNSVKMSLESVNDETSSKYFKIMKTLCKPGTSLQCVNLLRILKFLTGNNR